MQQSNFLMAGAVGVEDRSKRAETVRPQLGERQEKRRDCDSVLSATNDENGDELNGETDDEDMEDGEMGFDDGSAQVRNIRDPGQPTAKEHQEHMTTQRPCRSWCKFCVMGRAAKFIDHLGHNRFTLRCDNEPAIEALAREVAQAHQEGSQTVPERPPVGESQSNGIIERAVEPCCRSGQDTEGCIGASHWGQRPARRKDIVLAGGVCGIFAFLSNLREDEGGSRGSTQECLLAC